MEELNQELARAAYDKHLAAARSLPAEDVLPYRIDPDLAIINVKSAMAVVEAHRTEMATHLPEISLAELDALPSLALAVKMAALLAEQAAPAAVSPSAMIAEGWTLRAQLMPVVAALAAIGAIPQHVYDSIAEGKGTRDMAEDCVAISQVFPTYAAEIAGKHGADPAVVARAEVVGSWLLENLRTKHAPRPAGTSGAEVDVRDRMATLLVESYKKLRMVAYYFHQDAFGAHAPPLMSRHVLRKPAIITVPTASAPITASAAAAQA
jgi:hypothetical protein